MSFYNKIIFRADAGPTIGYGHFIRSLALADMLKNDFECVFATNDPTEYQKEELAKVCELISLKQQNHFEDFLDILSGKEIVVLDNYFFDTNYQQKIKARGCKLVCIDDMHDKHYVADLVINHSITDINCFSTEPYTKFCLGFNWALLRKPFIEAAKSKKKKLSNNSIDNIIVGFGGVDKYDLTGKTIEFLIEQTQVTKIDAIVGNAYEGVQKTHPNKEIIYHKNISSTEVANLFLNCDLAILSASTICIEALACKATVAAGYYVDNQEQVYNLWNKNNNIIGLGNLLDTTYFDKLESILTNFKPSEFNLNLEDLNSRYVSTFLNL